MLGNFPNLLEPQPLHLQSSGGNNNNNNNSKTQFAELLLYARMYMVLIYSLTQEVLTECWLPALFPQSLPYYGKQLSSPNSRATKDSDIDL